MGQQYDRRVEEGKCECSGRSSVNRTHFQHRAFDLLKVGDHLEKIPRLRVPSWAEHPHQALRRASEGCSQLEKAHCSVNILAQHDLPGIQIARGHAGQSFTEQSAPETRIPLKVRLHQIAKTSCEFQDPSAAAFHSKDYHTCYPDVFERAFSYTTGAA